MVAIFNQYFPFPATFFNPSTSIKTQDSQTMALVAPRILYSIGPSICARSSVLPYSISNPCKSTYCRGRDSVRFAHTAATTTPETSSTALSHLAEVAAVSAEKIQSSPPLSNHPYNELLRTITITACTSSRLLLPVSIRILSAIAYSTNPLLSPDRNPLLRWVLKRTVYAQFCGGETPQEVQHTIEQLKRRGVNGVLLGYAREVEVRGATAEATEKLSAVEPEEAIHEWARGTLETIKLAPEGDFVTIKYVICYCYL